MEETGKPERSWAARAHTAHSGRPPSQPLPLVEPTPVSSPREGGETASIPGPCSGEGVKDRQGLRKKPACPHPSLQSTVLPHLTIQHGLLPGWGFHKGNVPGIAAMLGPSTELASDHPRQRVHRPEAQLTPGFPGDDSKILQTGLAALTPKPRSALTPYCLLEVAKPG